MGRDDKVVAAPPPTVTVVVATYNRARSLARLFDGLVHQAFQDFDVVIVDDASTDSTPIRIRTLTRRVPFEVQHIRLSRNHGPGGARNVGWRRATGEVVAFIDDDCRPGPEWICELLGAMRSVDIVQGRTIADPAAERGPWSHTMEIERMTGSFETCNVAYRRALLERVRGFDESYRTGEDVDLGCRAVASGARAAFAPGAVVQHDVSPSSWIAHLRRLRHRDGAVRAIAAHPEMRRNLFHGWLFSPTHPPAILAAAAIAGLARPGRTPRPAVVALLAPYLASRAWVVQVPHARKWTWPWVLPLALAADLLEVGVLLRASARYRTLVL